MATTNDARLLKKRGQILDAAASAFAEEGYDAASMDRIAERAGASKRTVYNHFESKEVLFAAVAERLFRQLQQMKQVVWDPDRDLGAQLRGFAEVKARVASDPTWLRLLRVMLGVFIRQPELAEHVMAQVSEGEQHLIRWLQGAHQTGALQVPEPERAAQVFWALASGLLFWPQILSGPLSEQAKQAALDDVVQTFLGRYGPQ